MLFWLIVLLLVVVPLLLLAQWFKNQSPDLHTKLNAVIDTECDKLALAQEALQASEHYIREVKSGKEQTEADIRELKAKIKQALDGQDEAKAISLTEQLVLREHDLEECNDKVKKAIADHQENTRIIADFQRRIRNLRQDAKELRVQQGLADAAKNAAALRANTETSLDIKGIGDIKSEIEANIAAARATAAVDVGLSDAQKAFLPPAQTAEERLAKLKEEMKKG